MPQPAPDAITAIGKELKRARKRQGLSRLAAAALANISPDDLREVETGYQKRNGERRLGPTLSKLERIASVYGLKVSLTRSKTV
jgi:transcriptional regulator with XRE-family HTH domain